MRTALLIIDMQQALCAGQWAAFDIANVMARINALSAAARVAGAPVVLIQHEEPPETQGLVRDTPPWELAQGLVTAPGDAHIYKQTPDAFLNTPLHTELRARGVTRLVVCGLQTEFCVDSTTRAALAHGYHVVLAADAHSTLDGAIPAPQIIAHHNRTLGGMGGFEGGIKVKPAAEISFAA